MCDYCIFPVPPCFLWHVISKETRDRCSFFIWRFPVVIFSKRFSVLTRMCVCVCSRAHQSVQMWLPHTEDVWPPQHKGYFLQNSCSTPFHLLQPALPVSHKIKTFALNLEKNVSLVTFYSFFFGSILWHDCLFCLVWRKWQRLLRGD